MLRINRTAVTVAIGIVFTVIIAGSFAVGLIGLLQTAHVQADLLAEQLAPAIVRQDRRAASEMLVTLRHSPQVQAADLRDAQHRPFARYVRAGAAGPATDPGLAPFLLHVRQDFGNTGGRVGTLYLSVSLDSVLRQTAWLAIITLIAAAASLWVSGLLFGHLDRAVLAPLQALNDLMGRVHGASDFTIRARASHIAEIDALGRNFNEMIEKIHDRDQRLAQLAYFDKLTGLPNRPAFLDRLERELSRASRGGHRLGLLFLDLDGFKQVNDTLGHEAGDRLLVEAAARLRATLRPSDAAAPVSPRARSDATGPAKEAHPARLGGDEFTVLLPDLRDVGDVLVVARRIGDSLRRPFAIEGRDVAISASIGAAVFPEDGRDAATLLMHADAAMYHAKRAGRDNSCLYRTTLARSAPAQAGLDPPPGDSRAELDIGA